MRDVYAEITNRILADLDQGVMPWEKSWAGTGGNPALGLPLNASTGRAYRGINVLSLWLAGAALGSDDLRFLTFKQALDLGGAVKKGEKGFKVYFYKKVEVGGDEEAEEAGRLVPFLREFTVFHVSQVEGCKGLHEARETEAKPLPDDTAELCQALGAAVFHGGDRAFYQPGTDKLGMPWPDAFNTLNDYRATLYHELTHWTGHAARLDRKLATGRGTNDYAREELVAELGGAFLCAEYGLPYQTQHASYLKSWADVLRADKRAILQAASAAQKAVDFIRARAAGDGPSPEPEGPAKPAMPVAVAARTAAERAGKALAPQGAARVLVNRKALKSAVAMAAALVSGKSTIPLLQCLRLISGGKTLDVQATDLDNYISESLTVEGQGAFDAAVNAQALLNVLRKSTAEHVGLVADGAGLIVALPSGNVKLPGLNVADWPLPDGKGESALVADAKGFLSALQAVAHAMSKDETRYYLNGTFLHVTDGALHLVAIDGHQLARVAVPGVLGLEGAASVIVPFKACQLLARGFGAQAAGKLFITLGKAWSDFSMGNLRMISKMIDGTFPDYLRVIPRNAPHFVRLDGRELLQAVAQVASVEKSKARMVKLTFWHGEKLQLECSYDESKACVEVASDTVLADGMDSLSIGVNSAYLCNLCQAAGDDLRLQITDYGAPILAHGAAAGLELVVMPMRC